MEPDFSRETEEFDIELTAAGVERSTAVITPIASDTRRVICGIGDVEGLSEIRQSDYIMIDTQRWEILSDNFSILVDPTMQIYTFYIKRS